MIIQQVNGKLLSILKLERSSKESSIKGVVHSFDGSLDEMESFIKPTDPFYFVGHRLGNFQNYPKNINNPKYIPTYKNTIELMEYGFLKNGLNALEFDVRLGHDENVYITHDELTITPEAPGWEYLKKILSNSKIIH